jgi:hypothetical protein
MCQRWTSSKEVLCSVVLIAALVLCGAMAGVVQASGHIGVYAGGHETMGMGGQVVYTYSVELKADNSYELKSYFVMGDALYEFVETGAYTIDGSKLVITPEGQDPIEGSLNSDGTITVAVKPSAMASKRTESTLTRSNNTVAGVYTATFQGPTVVEVTLYLTHQGEYCYLAVPGNDSPAVHEDGVYSVNGTELTFKVADSDTTFAGTVQDGKVKAPFIVSAMMGMRMEIEVAK